MSGMETSINKTSGLSFFTSSTPCRPSRASPTISTEDSVRRIAFMPSTKRVWSSQMRIRALLLTLYIYTLNAAFTLFLHRQFDPEPAAAAGPGLDAHPAPHQFNGFPD